MKNPMESHTILKLICITVLIFMVFALSSCASLDEMGETGNPPTKPANIVSGTAEFVESSLCPLTTVQNIEQATLNVVHLIPFFADWEAVCDED